MSKFRFDAAIAVRAYGAITVEAGSLEEAKAKITDPLFDMEKHFSPHGQGKDDFDWNYALPAVYLNRVTIDDGAHIDLDEDLPDPA